MEMFLKISTLFSCIKDLRYVVTKIDTPFFSDNFPEEYPIGRDVDIICHPDDLEKLVQISNEIIHEEPNFSKHLIYDNENHVRFRLQAPQYFMRLNPRHYDKLINGHPMTKLHFQVDISTTKEEDFKVFSREFLDSIFDDFSMRNGVKVLDINKECTLRMLFWKNSPKSIHHLEYISENASLKILENIEDEEFMSYCETILKRIL